MVPAKRTSPKNTLLLKSWASSNVTFKNRRCVCYNGTTVMRTLPVTFCVVICGLSLSMLCAALGDTGRLFDSKTRCFHTKCVREARKVTSAEWAGRGLTGYLRYVGMTLETFFHFFLKRSYGYTQEPMEATGCPANAHLWQAVAAGVVNLQHIEGC